MPVFHFQCKDCGKPKKFLLEPEDVEGVARTCKACGGSLTRTPQPPSAHVKETLDNGLMERRVERFKDIEELMDERTHTDYRNKID